MMEKDEMKITIGPKCFIKRRGKNWSAVFTDADRDPRQKWKSLKTADQAAATAKAYEMLRQWESGRFDPWSGGGSDTTIAEAVRDYLKHKRGKNGRDNARMLERVAEHAGVRLLVAITPARIIDFIHKPGLSDASRWSYYNKIAACVNWLSDHGYFQKNPMVEVDQPVEPQTIPKHFKEDELERFLRGCELYYDKNKRHIHTGEDYPLWYMVAFELIAFSGLRKAEAERLNWSDVIWPGEEGIGGICVTQEEDSTKNKIDRMITMHPRAERVLRWCEENWRQTSEGNDPVLKNFSGKERLSGDYLSRKFTRVHRFTKNTKQMNLHGLRHTYAALLRRRGVPLAIIMEELGHKDVKTTQKYGKLAVDERMQATFSRF